MKKLFQRNIENFVCENCGKKVKGNGYTNHCFKCLWSKHVDINPGDRESDCGGMMEPISIEKKNGEERILYKCTKCGFKRYNKVQEEDDFAEVIKLSAN